MPKFILSLLLIFYFSLSSYTANAGIKSICARIMNSKASLLQDDLAAIREANSQNAGKREALLNYAAPKPKKWSDRAFVLADYAMATIIGINVIEGFQGDPNTILTALLMAPPTLYVADFISQVFHKWFDSYASEQNPIWGGAAREFRKHHEVPANLNDVDYLSHVSAFGKLMAPAFVGATYATMSPEWGASVWLLLVSLLNGTEFHKQAHKLNPSPFFKFLQSTKLAISFDHHARHHRLPTDTDYAILNGWSNPLSRKLKLWQRLDKVWWKVFRKMPTNWLQDPRSIPEEVLSELEDGLEEIPPELWDYAEMYPRRTTPRIQELLRER